MIKYNLIDVNGQGNITVVHDGEMYVANSEHPNWKAIVAGALDGDADVVDLFDTAKTVAKKFERLSERLSVAGGRIFFDGEEIDNSLTKQVVRFLDEGQEDYKPLLAFYEKVMTNPQEHSREQLYRFLERHNITIAEDGDIIFYKGVRNDGEGGWTSFHTGPAIVNGESVDGYVPQPLGAIIEMPRSNVAFDPNVACHTGLHCGTFSYASSFSYGNVIKVKVNPRDVVSVPNDANDQKVRVCRYTVLSVEIVPTETPSVYVYDADEVDEDVECGDCGSSAHETYDCDEDYCYYCDVTGHDEDDCDTKAEDEAELESEDEPQDDEPAKVDSPSLIAVATLNKPWWQR